MEEFGHAVRPRFRIRGAVEAPPGIGVRQTVIGPAVDQERRRSAPGALRHGILDGRGDRARSPMGQGEDDDVVPG